MTDKVCAKRYAHAYMESCASPKAVESAVVDLMQVRAFIESSDDLKAFLSSTVIVCAEKCDALRNIFAAVVSEDTLQFLLFVVEKGQGDALCEIAGCCQEIYRHTQRSEGVIKTTIALEPQTVSRIKAHLEKKLNKKLDMSVKIDPDIVGGIQVIIDNVIIDGSIKRRLDELRDKLLALKVG